MSGDPIDFSCLSKNNEKLKKTVPKDFVSNVYPKIQISEFWRTYGKFFSISESEKEPQIQPIIDSRFNMTEVHLAHEHVAGNKNCGKVLLKMNLN